MSVADREFAAPNSIPESLGEHGDRLFAELPNHRFEGGEKGGVREARFLDPVERCFRKGFAQIGERRAALVGCLDPVL